MYYVFKEIPNNNKHEDFFCRLQTLKRCEFSEAISNMFKSLYTKDDDVSRHLRKGYNSLTNNNLGLYYEEYLALIESLTSLDVDYIDYTVQEKLHVCI